MVDVTAASQAVQLLERADEQARIAAALDQTAQGEGRLVVLEGAPGAGKTSLVRVARRDVARALAGNRPVSEVLGEMVTREVERYRSRRLREGELDDREVIEALGRAKEQQQELQVIVERLERVAEAQRWFGAAAE